MNSKTLSVTCWDGQIDLLKRAAAHEHMSLSDYVRSRLFPVAAKDLGIALPHFPSFESPRFRRSVVARAAEALDMPVEQFKQRMAEKAAQAILDELTRPSSAPPPRLENVPPPAHAGQH